MLASDGRGGGGGGDGIHHDEFEGVVLSWSLLCVRVCKCDGKGGEGEAEEEAESANMLGTE